MGCEWHKQLQLQYNYTKLALFTYLNKRVEICTCFCSRARVSGGFHAVFRSAVELFTDGRRAQRITFVFSFLKTLWDLLGIRMWYSFFSIAFVSFLDFLDFLLLVVHNVCHNRRVSWTADQDLWSHLPFLRVQMYLFVDWASQMLEADSSSTDLSAMCVVKWNISTNTFLPESRPPPPPLFLTLLLQSLRVGRGGRERESDWGWRSNVLVLTSCQLQTGVPTHPLHEPLTCYSHWPIKMCLFMKKKKKSVNSH